MDSCGGHDDLIGGIPMEMTWEVARLPRDLGVRPKHLKTGAAGGASQPYPGGKGQLQLPERLLTGHLPCADVGDGAGTSSGFVDGSDRPRGKVFPGFPTAKSKCGYRAGISPRRIPLPVSQRFVEVRGNPRHLPRQGPPRRMPPALRDGNDLCNRVFAIDDEDGLPTLRNAAKDTRAGFFEFGNR